MIVDTSAIVAVLRDESDARLMLEALAIAELARLSAGTWIELGAVTSSSGPRIRTELDGLMTAFSIIIEPVDVAQARIGHEAYRRYGKGHHRAALNFGDCFAYALAKTTGEPLLFKGEDFRHTDIVSALPAA